MKLGLNFPYDHAAVVNGVLLVAASDASGSTSLWRTDGTSAGTHSLTTFAPSVRGMATVGGFTYFSSATAPELWRTDGTLAGTQLVWTSTQPNALILTLMPAASRLYLETGDQFSGSTLWVTTGAPGDPVTPLQTYPDGNVAQLRRTQFSGRHFRDALAIGDRLYFSQYTAAHGLELWTSAGTVGSTVEIELAAGMTSTAPTSFEALGTVLTFGAGRQLWRSDGTPGGTVPLAGSFMVGIAQGTNADSVSLGSRLVLNGWGTGPGALGLYSHDGSGAAAQHLSTTIFDFNPSNGHGYALTTNHLYSRALGSGDVWRTDGTSGGTQLVGSTYSGGGSDARRLTSVGGALFFWGNAPGAGFELYRIGMPIALPVAVADAYATAVGATLTVPVPGVLGNDLANGGGALTATVAATTSHGGLSFASDGSFVYVPNGGFSGVDAFTYRATNTHGTSAAASVSISVAPPPPAGPQPPTGLYAHSIVGNMVTIRWSAPATGPAPTSYIMDGGIAPGQPLIPIATGTAQPIFTFAAPNGIFYLQMRTVAGGQVSTTASNEIRISVNVPEPPSAPAGLLGSANGSTLALAWRNTFAGGSPGATILDVSGSISGSIPLPLTDSFAFAPVPGGTYTFSVRSTNAAGASSASNAVTLSFPSPCSGVPQTPVNFMAYASGNVVSLLWDPAASGAAPTTFVLTVSGAFNGALPLPTRGISAPVPPGTYNFTVTAANACGASAPTAALAVTVP